MLLHRDMKKNKNFSLEKKYYEKLFQSKKFKIIPNDIKILVVIKLLVEVN